MQYNSPPSHIPLRSEQSPRDTECVCPPPSLGMTLNAKDAEMVPDKAKKEHNVAFDIQTIYFKPSVEKTLQSCFSVPFDIQTIYLKPSLEKLFSGQ